MNTASKDFFKAKVGFRVGAGAEYKFDENLAADFSVVYQKGKKDRFIKRDIQAAAGILTACRWSAVWLCTAAFGCSSACAAAFATNVNLYSPGSAPCFSCLGSCWLCSGSASRTWRRKTVCA